VTSPTFTLGSSEPYVGGVDFDAWGWVMDAYGTARLAAKDAESAIVARICEDFNLTPVRIRSRWLATSPSSGTWRCSRAS
jgi:hypothetical protein